MLLPLLTMSHTGHLGILTFLKWTMDIFVILRTWDESSVIRCYYLTKKIDSIMLII